ncbi:MAG: hypothetical protein QM809_11760 [Gordonia sp. (in: high G+C Gram-positive bacteria)]|uniref:hypothetical protein n=1 Tax=Gordonia sp. (in: high G+C Gram-positive bacteria) TaxID=84139 RepID=UPI0039E6F1E8
MLTLALATTLIGFGLLVVALITGNFWLAVACIIVCVAGLVVLLVDTMKSGRRGGSGLDDEPLFTIRDGRPDDRQDPLHDDHDAEAPADDSGAFLSAAAPADDGGLGSLVVDTGAMARAEQADSGEWPLSGPQESASFATEAYSAEPYGAPEAPSTGASAYSAGAYGAEPYGSADPYSADPHSADPYSAAPPTSTGLESGPLPPVPAVGVEPHDDVATGDANDYVKSVTGTFPVQRQQTGAWPTSEPPVPITRPAESPSTLRPGVSSDAPATGPIPVASSPYVGRRRRAAADAADEMRPTSADPTVSGPLPPVGSAADARDTFPISAAPVAGTASSQGVRRQPSSSNPYSPSTSFPPAGPAPTAWTAQDAAPDRSAESAVTSSDAIIVHDHTGPLPKMTFKNRGE